MILITGTVRVRPDAVEDLRAAMEAQLSASRAEAGCIEYAYAVDVSEPGLIRVFEQWESWEALEVHFQQPHMKPWRAALQAAGIAERNLNAWEVGAGKSI